MKTHEELSENFVLSTKRFECDVCKGIFESQDLLISHIISSHKVLTLNAFELLNNYQYLSQKSCNYVYCGVFFENERSLILHNNEVHNEVVFKCIKCQFVS